MSDVTYKIHWLAFTVHAPNEDAFTLYDILFKDLFGSMYELGKGGRMFKEIYHNSLEMKIYLTPINGSGFFHFEIPGKACEVLNWEYFFSLGQMLESNYPQKFSFTRLDFAFDNLEFTPQQVDNAIRLEQVRSLAKRESLELHESPYKLQDDGKKGTCTVEFGSDASQRMITVYNKRGFTRLELQVRRERAHVVASEILMAPSENDWFGIAISHLRDFIDIKTEWWDSFVNGAARAGATVSNPREISMSKIVKWLDRQVSPSLSVIVDALPDDVLKNLINRGRVRRGPRYSVLLGDENKNAAPGGSVRP